MLSTHLVNSKCTPITHCTSNCDCNPDNTVGGQKYFANISCTYSLREKSNEDDSNSSGGGIQYGAKSDAAVSFIKEERGSFAGRSWVLNRSVVGLCFLLSVILVGLCIAKYDMFQRKQKVTFFVNMLLNSLSERT